MLNKIFIPKNYSFYNIKNNIKISFSQKESLKKQKDSIIEINNKKELIIHQYRSNYRFIIKGYKGKIRSTCNKLISNMIIKEKKNIEESLFGFLKKVGNMEYFRERLKSFSSATHVRKKADRFLRYIFPSLLDKEFIFCLASQLNTKINNYMIRKNLKTRFNPESIRYFFRKIEKEDILRSMRVIIKECPSKRGTVIGKVYFINKLPYEKNKWDQLLIKREKKEFDKKVKEYLKGYQTIEDDADKILSENTLISITKGIKEKFFDRLQQCLDSTTRNKYRPLYDYFYSFIPIKKEKNKWISVPFSIKNKIFKIHLLKKIKESNHRVSTKIGLRNMIHLIFERGKIFQTYYWFSKKLRLSKWKIRSLLDKLKKMKLVSYELIKGRGHFVSIIDYLPFLKRGLPKVISRKKDLYRRFNLLRKRVKDKKINRVSRESLYQDYYKIGIELGFFKV